MFDGKEYEVDCIIFATGFEVVLITHAELDIRSLVLTECRYRKWSNGLSTYHGMHSRGFPNCFFWPAQSAFTATYTFSLDENSVHLAHIMTELKKRGATRVEASQAAEDAWVNTIIQKARLTRISRNRALRVITTMRGT